MAITRLPAIPVWVHDPYLSIWCPADTLTDTDTCHWCGDAKPIYGALVIDGAEYRFMGLGDAPAMRTASQEITPTATKCVFEAGCVLFTLSFTSAALPDDPDALSSPVLMVDMALACADGREHECEASLFISDALCYHGDTRPDMHSGAYRIGEMNAAYIGQLVQRPLCHSGDHTTIDWGYLYLASRAQVERADNGLRLVWRARAGAETKAQSALIAYDDIASINYFGDIKKAWCFRDGQTIVDCLRAFDARKNELMAKCRALDERVLADAMRIGGDDYALITAAAWRHAFAAHKLIADNDGRMVLLSKENDSNGCIGTVDVSYPSMPLFLRYCPQLVNALCRPVLVFAELPAWGEAFAPHDVGRYPYATGQVYAARERGAFRRTNAAFPPYYLYPAGANIYDARNQMPVEECGNMLIMLAVAYFYTGDASLILAHRALIERWAEYLAIYGEDPGEQLCTDDFAGHLKSNVNLAAKALIAVKCYARVLDALGEESARWHETARRMAESFLTRVDREGGAPLTFDGAGWSMKYNLVWDEILGLGLLPKEFYEKEIGSYFARARRYGLPLDSRASYTKSDWLVWTATMAGNKADFARFIAPLAAYLRESPSRVAFSDWYDTDTGEYVHFIARSVQGGLYMPMLKQWN